MNRGFAFYFKNAMKSSVATIWKNRNILLVMAYFLSELVARVTVIFSAVFDLADVRQAKTVEENERMDIAQTLKVSTKSKPVWTMVFSIIAEAFIFLGGTLIIAAITGVFALIGFAIAWAAHGPLYIILIFCIPGGLLFVAYAVLMCLIFSPTPYIIETNPTLGVYETVKICFDTMKGRGKMTSFLNFFIPTLIEGAILGICIGGYFLIFNLMGGEYVPVVLAIWLIFSLALSLLTLPMFDLAKKLAQKSLFEDIVLDPVNANKRTAGINIKMCTGVKFEPSAVKGNLVALFDETQPDSIPEPDSPARKKVKEKAEKAAKNKQEENNTEEEVKAEQTENSEPAYEQPEQAAASEPVNEPATEQPAEQQYEQPAYEQPAYEQPAYEQPTYQQPTYEQPAYEQPAYEQPTYEQPTYEQPTYEQPAYEQPEQNYAEPATEESQPEEKPKKRGWFGRK